MHVRGEKSKLLVFLILGLLFTLILPYFLSGIQFLGYRIPQNYLEEDYLKGFIIGSFLFFILTLVPFPKEDRKNILIVWATKLFVTLVFMLFYEFAYGLDAYWYFQRSQLSVEDLSSVGWGRGTGNLVYCLWYLEHNLFALASYHSQKVFSSFFGFLGIYLFYRGMVNYLKIDFPKLFLLLGLFPSVLFWSSILGKDPIILFGIGLCYYGMLTIIRSRQYIHLFTIVIGLCILAAIRMWMVPIILFPFFLGFLLKSESILFKICVILIGIAASIYSLRYIGTTLQVESMESLTNQVDSASKAWQRGGSAGSVPQLSSFGAMIAFLPLGMFTALFRPLPLEVMNLFGLLAGLENIIVLYLLFKSLQKMNRPHWQEPISIWLATFVILWSMVYAFISPQNLGSSVRFKLQVLLPLLGILLINSGLIKDEKEIGS